jgi:hypothetical protein
MKKILLLAVIVGSFSLLSFRNVSDVKITTNPENPKLHKIESTADYFTAYYREFPDKFVSSRETWTKVSAIFSPGTSPGQLVVSENEMEELLKNL